MPGKPGDSAALPRPRGFPVSVPPLQPCPFCGDSDVWINGDIEPKFVACRKCWAFGPSAPTVTQAAERWNKRAPSPQTNTGAATSG
jgi:Lar family restriction alleviation protein